jgi:hypothetical protein
MMTTAVETVDVTADAARRPDASEATKALARLCGGALPEYLKLSVVCRLLMIGERTARRWLQQGRLKGIRSLNGTWLISVPHLLRELERAQGE